jgi:hypothetical protein
MKTLKQIINEELDDNLLYMIDMWFERNEDEMQEFIELIIKCKKDHIININKLKTYIDETNIFRTHLCEFINFVDNDIYANTEKDYYNKLKSILEQVIANKSKQNKYIKMEVI